MSSLTVVHATVEPRPAESLLSGRHIGVRIRYSSILNLLACGLILFWPLSGLKHKFPDQRPDGRDTSQQETADEQAPVQGDAVEPVPSLEVLHPGELGSVELLLPARYLR